MIKKIIIPSQEKLLINIDKKLSVITRLLALSLPSTINQNQKIVILSEMGQKPKEIAVILGTTNNTVRVELSKMKKFKKKRVNEND